MTKSFLAVAVILLQGGSMAAQARPTATTSPAWIWWEAEAPRATNFPAVNPFAPTDEKAAKVLSNGAWIGASHPDKTLFVEYEVRVPKTAAYRFYARKFWHHGPFRWRFDDQPWRNCGRDVALLDDVSMSRFVDASWVAAGAVDLKAGVHTVRIELDKTTEATAFDCFVLTAGPFTARGKLKPGEKVDGAPPGWFAFEPDADPFGPAALDLRCLNEAFAGQQRLHPGEGRQLRSRKDRPAGPLLGRQRRRRAPRQRPRRPRSPGAASGQAGRQHGAPSDPLWREDDATASTRRS